MKQQLPKFSLADLHFLALVSYGSEVHSSTEPADYLVVTRTKDQLLC